MAKYASKILAQAKSWLGYNEADGSHKKIIDVYNGHKPLARGYKVKYDDNWCATFVSAVAIATGYTDLIPTECSCGRMIELMQKKGIWNESDARIPNPGDLLLFNWQASKVGDDKGWPDHIGIVERVDGDVITLIEGNYSQSVKRRAIKVDDYRIRGYGCPTYDAEPVPVMPKTFSLTMRQLKRGDKGEDVRALQILLAGRGFKGNMHEPDGVFGPNTEGATILAQKAYDLKKDGIAGIDTMTALLGK